MDIDAELAERARLNLRASTHVTVVCADGRSVDRESFDAIFANAGVTHIPDSWLDGLRAGGRMLVPLTVGMPGYNAGIGEMFLVTRIARGYGARVISPVGVFHCAVARTGTSEQTLQEAFAHGNSGAIRSLRRDEHPRDAQCWLHGPQYCLSLQEHA